VLDSLDFVKLNHASMQADPTFTADSLEVLYREIQERQSGPVSSRPRLLLIGPNIGFGDYNILKLTSDLGGNIVIEEVFEGIRNYWDNVNIDGDLIDSLARAYLLRRVPAAFMRFSARKRLDFALELISEFDVSGIIWSEMLCCETYDAESYFFSERMRERKIPMLVLESDYGMANQGQTRTRIEAFLEMVKGGLK
jgi:benzoyl-CoA reductase/2-hydroxyglutaryl-CoA dehydratase subunit BcrC/BadD/HgdB